MKGLLLKDLYAVKSYFRSFLFLMAIFLIMSAISSEIAFYTFYPCILTSVLAMSLIAYEEREKWNVYALTLPFSRAQLVSAKYIVSLLFGLSTVLLTAAVRAIAMLITNSFQSLILVALCAEMIPLTLIPNAIMLPFIYRFGAEKGRIAYYFVIGGFCALVGMLGGFDITVGATDSALPLGQISSRIILLMVSIILYALSWLLSVKLYQKREI